MFGTKKNFWIFFLLATSGHSIKQKNLGSFVFCVLALEV